MNNQVLYYKTKLIEKIKTQRDLANYLMYDESYISKYFNESIEIPSNYMSRINEYFNIKELKPFDDNIKITIEHLIDDVVQLNKNKEYDIKLQEDALTYPYQILALYLYKHLKNEFDHQFDILENLLNKIINHFEIKHQQVFYVISGYSLMKEQKYQKAERIINRGISLSKSNDEIKGVLLYYLVQIHSWLGKYSKVLTEIPIAQCIFENYNIHIRQVKILVSLANTYSKMGCLDQSIEINKDILKKVNDKDNLLGVNIIVLYNIAYQYGKKKEYQKALNYYLKAYEIQPDDDMCFEIAWCYYQLHDAKKALIYLEYSNQVLSFGKIAHEKCRWLKEHIKHPYNRECLFSLKRILKKYNDELGIDNKMFVYIQLIEYYQVKEDYKKALDYSIKLNQIGVISSAEIKKRSEFLK